MNHRETPHVFPTVVQDFFKLIVGECLHKELWPRMCYWEVTNANGLCCQLSSAKIIGSRWESYKKRHWGRSTGLNWDERRITSHRDFRIQGFASCRSPVNCHFWAWWVVWWHAAIHYQTWKPTDLDKTKSFSVSFLILIENYLRKNFYQVDLSQLPKDVKVSAPKRVRAKLIYLLLFKYNSNASIQGLKTLKHW